MKTTWLPRPLQARTLALGSVVGCLMLGPVAWAGEEPAVAPSGAAPAVQASPTSPGKSAKQAKAPKQAKVSKKARGAQRPSPAAPAQLITGSHLKQRTVLRRFPETTSPVEIWDRQVIERRGEATLGGFLVRQATFR